MSIEFTMWENIPNNQSTEEYKMISYVFSSKEIVKIFDFLLDNPFSQFTKSDIAEGSSVSRPTVSKIVPDLIKMGVLEKKRSIGHTELVELNVSSPLVMSLIKFDSELSKVFVSLNMDQLNTNTSEIDLPEIVHVLENNHQREFKGNTLILTLKNKPGVEKRDESVLTVGPNPSSA